MRCRLVWMVWPVAVLLFLVLVGARIVKDQLTSAGRSVAKAILSPGKPQLEAL